MYVVKMWDDAKIRPRPIPIWVLGVEHDTGRKSRQFEGKVKLGRESSPVRRRRPSNKCSAAQRSAAKMEAEKRWRGVASFRIRRIRYRCSVVVYARQKELIFDPIKSESTGRFISKRLHFKNLTLVNAFRHILLAKR